MADKARHAFGNSANLDTALQAGTIDAYDILFLDGDTDPKVGWVDKNGVVRLVEDKTQIIRVDELPAVDGDQNVVYIYNNEGYVWDGEKCVSIAKSADLTVLEEQMANLEIQMDQKVDAETVQTMIKEQTESMYEIVEF